MNPQISLAETGASTVGNSGSRVNIHSIRGCRCNTADNSAGAFNNKRLLHIRKYTIFIHQFGLLTKPRHRSHSVEKVSQHQGEHQQRAGQETDTCETSEDINLSQQ